MEKQKVKVGMEHFKMNETTYMQLNHFFILMIFAVLQCYLDNSDEIQT